MSLLVICGTDRPNARSRIVARDMYNQIKGDKKIEVKYLDLLDFPESIPGESRYDQETFSDEFVKLQEEVIIPATKFIFVVPEYNGAFPGILKVFIDKLSMRKAKESLQFKKVLLVGVSQGRAGNLRGMEYLTGILNHMKVVVYPVKQPISQVGQFLDESTGIIKDEQIRDMLNKLCNDFIDF